MKTGLKLQILEHIETRNTYLELNEESNMLLKKQAYWDYLRLCINTRFPGFDAVC